MRQFNSDSSLQSSASSSLWASSMKDAGVMRGIQGGRVGGRKGKGKQRGFKGVSGAAAAAAATVALGVGQQVRDGVCVERDSSLALCHVYLSLTHIPSARIALSFVSVTRSSILHLTPFRSFTYSIAFVIAMMARHHDMITLPQLLSTRAHRLTCTRTRKDRMRVGMTVRVRVTVRATQRRER